MFLFQAVNYLGAPLQLVCILPFMRLGARIFGGTQTRRTIAEMVSLVEKDPRGAIDILWESTWHAIGAWALVAPAAAAVLYFLLRAVLRGASERLRAPKEAADAA